MYSQDFIKQAPAIVYNGEKQHEDSKWTCMCPVELQRIIFNNIDYRSTAELKVMLALVGCAEGFKISEQWIIDQTGVAKSSYIRARQNLVKRGWITHTKEEEIIINFDAIYACGEGSTVKPSQDNEGSTVNNEGITVKPSQGSTVIPSQGSTVKPIIKEYNKKNINKKNEENIYSAPNGAGAAAAQAPQQTQQQQINKEKAELEAKHEAYRKEMIALNDKFFDGVQAYKAKFGDDYSNHTEYIVWREGITAETEALKKKYNIGQKQ